MSGARNLIVTLLAGVLLASASGDIAAQAPKPKLTQKQWLESSGGSVEYRETIRRRLLLDPDKPPQNYPPTWWINPHYVNPCALESEKNPRCRSSRDLKGG